MNTASALLLANLLIALGNVFEYESFRKCCEIRIVFELNICKKVWNLIAFFAGGHFYEQFQVLISLQLIV